MAFFGGYRTVWLIVLFDLPTATADERTDYRHFHDLLLDDGFSRLQFSVYARHCASDENAEVHTRRIHGALPPDGEVRVMTMTDKQFGRMSVFHGQLRRTTERPPEQVLLL
ncbi:CRISPR-associated endonuclease Cas2 [Rhodocyclus tenuis]|uniref:CRISPR-associated endonuclease Cas2 n=1 Tax=Rhodocyclus tenuis TaxID=1066 RepID=UPI003B8A9916|nr:CRISPR-associated endonuclease Cas2 [Rhodocyclus tenuis]